MSDITVLELKIDNIASDVKDIKTDIETMENVQDDMSGVVDHIEQWRKGNGARGAEVRLQEVEKLTMDIKHCVENVSSDEAIQRIAAIAARGVIENAKSKDRTTVAKLRAVGPLLTGFAAFLTGIGALVAVLVK